MMDALFLQNRPARRYFTATALLCALTPAAGALAGWAAVLLARRLWAARLAACATALLGQGLTPGQAAAALSAVGSDAAGQALAAQMGGGPALDAAPCIALGAGLAVLPALLIAVLCARWLARQERAAETAVQTVCRYAAGEFSARLPRDGSGAPGRLLRAVDELATALRAKSEAEGQSRALLKDAVSDISHQLKTPLAALALYNDILAADPADAQAVARFTQKTAAALARITALVQMLLKLAQLDAGSIAFEKAPHPAAALAARAAEPLAARAAAEGKTLRLLGEDDVTVFCDAAWTVEALGNLIKNAVDHTGPGGHITVAWQAAPGQVRIAVSDDGEGIPPEVLPHIFKRFYRSAAAPGPGVGLGLPLAKAVVEGQNGILSVESTPGGGSVFCAAFPAG